MKDSPKYGNEKLRNCNSPVACSLKFQSDSFPPAMPAPPKCKAKRQRVHKFFLEKEFSKICLSEILGSQVIAFEIHRHHEHITL